MVLFLPEKIDYLDLLPFRPRWPWIGADLQTLRNRLCARRVNLEYWKDEELELPLLDGSGDRLLAVLQRPDGWKGGRLLVLIHGLTGCAESAYMRNSAEYFLSLGQAVLRLNLRGAGPGRRLSTSLYHSGRSEDLVQALLALLRHLPRGGETEFYLMGFSLGANILIKALAGELDGLKIKAAVAVSTPIDLKAAQVRISASRNKIYHDYIFTLMRRNLLAGPGVSEEEQRLMARQVRNLHDFDRLIVAPRFGFSSAEDYYESCSAKRFLGDVRIPTLIIQADDDPWIPRSSYDAVDWQSLPSCLKLLMTRGGGHAGFHGKGSLRAWHDRVAATFFDDIASLAEQRAA